MQRRALLTSLAAASGALVGCGAPASGGDDPTTESTRTTTDDPTPTTTERPATAHTVRVEMVRTSGLTGRETRLIVEPDGKLTLRRTCGEASAERSMALPAADHDALVEAVLSADRSSMADSYECTGECPMDIPGRRYRLTVDGVETSVFVEAQADGVPEGLARIQRRVGDLRERLETPPCTTTDG